jgi:hypothetical protein
MWLNDPKATRAQPSAIEHARAGPVHPLLCS